VGSSRRSSTPRRLGQGTTNGDNLILLHSLGVGDLDLAGAVSAELVQHLADFGRQYDVDDLKRFAPAKRYAIVACFLVKAQKTILDHVVEMHREYLTGMARRARNTVDQRHRDAGQRANKSLATILRVMEILTDESMPQGLLLGRTGFAPRWDSKPNFMSSSHSLTPFGPAFPGGAHCCWEPNFDSDVLFRCLLDTAERQVLRRRR
jgi:hypothetical protein